jgi:hypothetical protein
MTTKVLPRVLYSPRRKVAAALPMAVAVTVAMTWGATYHVDVLGDDDAKGTERTPWRTIQRAVQSAQPGACTCRIRNEVPEHGYEAGE